LRAQLHCKDDCRRRDKAHRHLCQPRHPGGRGGHIRLQVPSRGGQDPMSLRLCQLQRLPEL
ncbi:hypothetical protein GGF38_005704, partial [Coemansia sp. RSA 25]